MGRLRRALKKNKLLVVGFNLGSGILVEKIRMADCQGYLEAKARTNFVNLPSEFPGS